MLRTILYFCHALNNIGFLIRGKLLKTKSVGKMGLKFGAAINLSTRICLLNVFNLNLSIWLFMHCKEDSDYVLPEIKLRGLVPNFHIHTSVSDIYIPRIGPPILLQPNRQTYRGNTVYKSLTAICM